jgi:hypothetical protein
MNTTDFVKEVNRLRITNRNNWYTTACFVNGKIVRLKGFNTWIQVIRIDDYSCSGLMDISVKDFKAQLKKWAEL